MFNLSEDDIHRYSRHILLKEVGVAGQEKLSKARVLVVGTGGLGSPVSYYLAAAGIGKLGIIDSDKVELSNLQRQILHSTDDLGKAKVQSAAEKLRKLNPRVDVVTYEERLSAQNVMAILQDYDMVVDGTDNFPVRFVINDACVLSNKPFFHGGVLRFFGQVMTIIPGEGPCYRCIFHEPPPPGSAPTCAEAGVLGAVVGVIGLLQATEVLKYIVGIGQPLVGRLLTFEALDMKFRDVEVAKDPRCAVCGDHPTIMEVFDYEQPLCDLKL